MSPIARLHLDLRDLQSLTRKAEKAHIDRELGSFYKAVSVFPDVGFELERAKVVVSLWLIGFVSFISEFVCLPPCPGTSENQEFKTRRCAASAT